MMVRPATHRDFDQMWRIFRAVVAAGDTYVFAEDTSSTVAHEYFLGSGVSSFVCEVDNTIVGMYKVVPNLPDRGSHVANASFMVDPRWQDRGVGRKLAQHCLHEAWARGYLAMQFNFVVSTNTRAVRLWESLGFNIVGTLPKVFRHRQLGDVDAYVMFRPLEKVPDSSEEVPSFGTVDTSLPYVVRPSAYALFRNAHGDLAAVRTSRGVCLPGGALDPGESPEQAAVREVAEECAISVEAGARVCYAVSIQNAPIDQVCYEKRNTFLEARLIEPLATTPHHELVWLPLKHAAERLTSKSHAWAVTRYTI